MMWVRTWSAYSRLWEVSETHSRDYGMTHLYLNLVRYRLSFNPSAPRQAHREGWRPIFFNVRLKLQRVQDPQGSAPPPSPQCSVPLPSPQSYAPSPNPTPQGQAPQPAVQRLDPTSQPAVQTQGALPLASSFLVTDLQSSIFLVAGRLGSWFFVAGHHVAGFLLDFVSNPS